MSQTTTDPESIRRDVSESYARAVERPTASSCCSGPSTKGVVVAFAGYGDELASLPDDAVTNSFGCGNPLAFAGVRPGQTVLDLGSGAGIDLLIAAERVGPTGRVIGVDMTEEMIERARANVETAGASHVEVRRGLIEALPVDDASVDWVISNCVINLSPEKGRVFAEISRVLRPGGRFSISDIVVEELPTAVRESTALYSSCVAGAISEAEYLTGLREAGLEAEVTERLVYDTTQLAAFVRSELAEAAPRELDLDQVVSELDGKVWSAKVSGGRPA